MVGVDLADPGLLGPRPRHHRAPPRRHDRSRDRGGETRMTYRVIQWSTGNVGRHALRCIERHPDLELVGAVGALARQGRARTRGSWPGSRPTACSRPTTSTRCSRSTPTASATPRPPTSGPAKRSRTSARILASGKNVVSSSVVSMIYPPHVEPGMREPLEDACATGNVVVLHVGHRSRLGERPAAVRAHRRVRVHRRAARDGGRQLRDLRAADRAVRHDGLRPGARLEAAAVAARRAVVRVGRRREGARGRPRRRDRRAPRGARAPARAARRSTSASAWSKKGTTAAMRFEVQGIVDGEAAHRPRARHPPRRRPRAPTGRNRSGTAATA